MAEVLLRPTASVFKIATFFDRHAQPPPTPRFLTGVYKPAQFILMPQWPESLQPSK